MLNRQIKLNLYPLEEAKDASGEYFCVRYDSVRTSIPRIKENHVIIESSSEELAEAVVVHATTRAAKKQPRLLLFTYADLFKSTITPVVSKSINGTTKIEFDVPSDGAYFVFPPKSAKAWLLIVKAGQTPPPADSTAK